jgi:hypothetical protein
MFGLTKKELAILRRLSTPAKVQDYLDSIPMNWEKKGDTHYSPRNVLRNKKAHCIEGAALAALAFWVHDEEPLIMDLYARDGTGDVDHVVALYKKNGYWGCVSKTNHPTIRFRDPVYKTLRELALSYFHEWFMNTSGEKTLESYSKSLNLKRFGTLWITSEEDLWYFDDALNALPHYKLVPKGNRTFIRKADKMELAAGRLVEWSQSNRHT